MNTKLEILYFITQMNDITEDIKYLLSALKKRQITKKELKKNLKTISKIHESKVSKLSDKTKNYLNDSTY